MLGLETSIFILLCVCLFCACAFEFVNGFHDTANAVATVIYTNSLQPNIAVVWSGICNFLGVITGGIGVAMGIVNLLPVEMLIDQNVYHSIAMVLALLLSAIIWNLGTWYFGLPSSSSHTLIGSILGVGLAFTLLPENSSGNIQVNTDKAYEILLSLLISPVVGFSLAIFMMFFLRRILRNDAIFKEPKKNTPPPRWIRGLLILTCTGVSYAHGNNDGQKGVGLVMLILIGVTPAFFALNADIQPAQIRTDLVNVTQGVNRIDPGSLSAREREKLTLVKSRMIDLDRVLSTATTGELPATERLHVRRDILLIDSELKDLLKSNSISLSDADRSSLREATSYDNGLRRATDFAPLWVIILISISLGLGTMIGWKRIVVTVGEKIGKQHLTYAQGASAELMTFVIIMASSLKSLPVSTTHILSSGIAGSMVASKGIKNLQAKTVRNIALAWVLTLPVSIMLAGTLFIVLRNLLG
ncbi:MAG: inorganic phosphate transporter [Cytophagaceae bacterium]|nr:inorganic phosphate transporter [Cytophagaceae bacterium]